MSESAPRNASFEAGLALQRQDEEDPVRGPIVNLSRKVLRAAYEDLEHPFLEEFEALQASFPKQFADPKEAWRYRLYHYIIGSSVEPKNDLFDTEGPQSLTEGIRKLAQRYNIDTGGV